MLCKLNSGFKVYPLIAAIVFMLFETAAYASSPARDSDSDLSSGCSYTSAPSDEDSDDSISKSTAPFELFYFEDNSEFEKEEIRLCSAAASGCANDQYHLAVFYRSHPEQPDYIKKTYEWLIKSADQHYLKAHYLLGLMFENREIFDKNGLSNQYRSLIEYEKAANLNHTKAQYKVGVIYRYGYGVEINYSKAQHYLELASDTNNFDAHVEWIKMYEGNLLPRTEQSSKRFTSIEASQRSLYIARHHLNKFRLSD